mgnify:CR=1 FL=1
MKTKILKYSLLTAIIGIALWSCNKEDIKSVNHTSSIEPSMMLNSNITEIGNLHNDILETTFTDFDYTVSDYLAEIKTNFLLAEIEGLDESTKLALLNDTNNYDRSYINNNLTDQIAKDYISSGELIIDTATNYTSMFDGLSNLKQEIESDSRDFNKDVALIFCEVSIKSSYFWLNSSVGGSGIGSNILKDLDREQLPGVSPYVRDIIAADGLGAAGVFTSYGLFAGMTGPIGWGALVVSVGFGAAWSSITTAVINYKNYH